jgi:hypothetical protein
MNTLTFCVTIDPDTLDPLEYDLTGSLMIEGEQTPIGLSSTNFDKVFDELLYWVRLVGYSAEVKFTNQMLTF